jgi:hypothetical protein
MSGSSAIVRSCSIADAVRALISQAITHVSIADDYWHSQVFLRTSEGTVFEFFSEEHPLAHLFDVYSIAFGAPKRSPEVWGALDAPFQVESVHALWRDEWLVPGAAGPTLGNNPHTQHSGPVGTAPPSAVASATVLAGILIAGPGNSAAVTASITAPLNIDFAVGTQAVSAVLAKHTVRGVEG